MGARCPPSGFAFRYRVGRNRPRERQTIPASIPTAWPASLQPGKPSRVGAKCRRFPDHRQVPTQFDFVPRNATKITILILAAQLVVCLNCYKVRPVSLQGKTKDSNCQPIRCCRVTNYTTKRLHDSSAYSLWSIPAHTDGMADKTPVAPRLWTPTPYPLFLFGRSESFSGLRHRLVTCFASAVPLALSSLVHLFRLYFNHPLTWVCVQTVDAVMLQYLWTILWY